MGILNLLNNLPSINFNAFVVTHALNSTSLLDLITTYDQIGGVGADTTTIGIPYPEWQGELPYVMKKIRTSRILSHTNL